MKDTLAQYIKAYARNKKGSSLIYILVFGSVATMIIISGVATYALFEHQASNRKHARDMSFHIAEAGIDYYRWHLAHNPTDFQDGTGQPGPYVHEYVDKNGTNIGFFSLEIDPPLAGSTVATIRSTGWVNWQPQTTRTIQVRAGFPALTDYTFLTNANMNFSFTTEVHGQVHSNGGIRFDGTSDSWVKSARDRYQYENQQHDGVWGGGGPRAFWNFPVPAIDFNAITADLGAIRDSADDGGIHLNSSGDEGWHVVFNGNNFDLFRVTDVDCYPGSGRWRFNRWNGWFWDGTTYCYDVGAEVFVANHQIPENGAVFIEDNTWVEGQVDGRVTVGVGRFPVQAPYETIYIQGNLTYAERSSDDVTGLLAQGDIIVPHDVPDTMTIDAALLSQFGVISRPYYDSDLKTLANVFGSQISYAGGGWKWTNGWGNVISGFVNTNHTYDANLSYYPPP
ncbi:MAG: hypothetical protein COU33_02560, partial [Candidatus Magasanikbacteria bacterium CG10_big_fil_rev_8_21_14_0_10_43_6]